MVNYEYYANGWLKNVKKAANLIAEYEYDNVGNRTKLTYGNDSYQDFAYEDDDPRYRLATIDYAYKCDINSNIESHGGLKFTRDNSGNPLTWGDNSEIDKYTKSYEYDNNSRLKSANYPGHPTQTWSYDWVGNRNNTDLDYEYNDADQLTDSPNKSYEYYGNGNLHLINTNEKVFTYTYNNLVNTVTSGSNVSTMLWDTSGNRVRLSTSSSQVYDFLYDTTAGVPAVIEEATTSGSIYYVREPEGALLARVSGSTPQYYHFDELGSTLFMTDSNAVISDSYTYDAWGNVTSHTGNTNQPYQYVGLFGYYTHYQDSNLPYMQTGVRLYNPEVGRYMQLDDLKDGINFYVYVSSNSLMGVDPNGKRKINICGNGGHLWICADGVSDCWGFYPKKKTIDKVTDGIVLDDDENMKGSGNSSSSSSSSKGKKNKNKKKCLTIEISDCQYQQLIKCLQTDYKNPPKYTLKPEDVDDPPYNCVSWVDHIMICAGIDYHSHSDLVTWPNE